MATLNRVIPAFCVAASLSLAGCVATPQNSADSGDLFSSASWAQSMEHDRQLVQQGELPPKVLEYDQQIARMLPEGRAIMASHDRDKARVWSKKFKAVVAAKFEASRAFDAKSAAKHTATANALGNGRPDYCRDEMGRNVCPAQPVEVQPRLCPVNNGSSTSLVPC